MNQEKQLAVKKGEIVFDVWFIVFIIFGAFRNLGWFQPFFIGMSAYLQNDILYVCLFAVAATGFINYSVSIIVQCNHGDYEKSIDEYSFLKIILFIFISIYFVGICVSVPMELYVWQYSDLTHAPSPKAFTAIVLIFIQTFYSCYLIAVIAYPDLYYDNRVVNFFGGMIILLFGFYLPLYAYVHFYSSIEAWIGGFFGGILCLACLGSLVYALWKVTPKLLLRFERKSTGLEFSENKFINEFLHPSFLAISVFLWIVLFEKNIKEYHFALDFLKGIIPLRILFLLVPPINYLNLAIGAATVILFYALNW